MTLFRPTNAKRKEISHFARNSGKYPLCGRGDVNTYTLFAELSRHVQSGTGRVGVIVPSGIATDDTPNITFRTSWTMGRWRACMILKIATPFSQGCIAAISFAC